MKAIICFGEVLIDFQPILPSPTTQTARFEQHAGGAPANVAVAVAALGGKAEFVGMLGTDPFSDFLLDSLRRANVATTHIQRTSAAPTALAFVTLDENGERSFSFYRSPAADLLFRESRLPARAFAKAAILHACSNSLTEEGIAQATLACMRRAREAGALVSFDMNLRPALWPAGVEPGPRIRAALALADVVKLSAEELAFLAAFAGSESAALDAILSETAQLVLVTDGARPIRWRARDTHGTLDTYEVEAIDSTAAGDAFSGGILFALADIGIDTLSLPDLIGDPARLNAVLRFGAACGALATTRRGAFAAMPSRAEVEALIRSTAIETLKVAS
ncbi:MAG: carbohydrate kinase [Dokdonella sp.]